MSFRVTCESSADLTPELYKKHNIGVLPFTITIGDKDFKDGTNMTNEEMFENYKINKVLPKTSALNAFDYEEVLNCFIIFCCAMCMWGYVGR